MIEKWYCPVCGLDSTQDAVSNGGLFESSTIYDTSYILETHICPCCYIEFGCDDWNKDERPQVYIDWRKKWIADGMKWNQINVFDIIERKPVNWDPRKQMKNIPKEFLSPNESY